MINSPIFKFHIQDSRRQSPYLKTVSLDED
jgi:hypothetical protein